MDPRLSVRIHLLHSRFTTHLPTWHEPTGHRAGQTSRGKNGTLMIRTTVARISRFVRKPMNEKAAAVGASLKHIAGRGPGSDPGAALADHRFGAPAVFRSKESRYFAIRPEGDRVFGNYPELAELSEAWVSNNRPNAGDLPRLYALVLNIRRVLAEGVPGDFAELGVYHGNSAAVLAHYARQATRQTILFDTFGGFDSRDFVGPDRNPPPAFADTSVESVRRLVGDDRVRYLPGWFPASVPPDLLDARFSIVHLDCDLYAPIKAGIEFFFPRLSAGGLMVVHDYSNPHWVGVKQAVDEFLASREERLVLLPDRSGTAMFRKIVGRPPLI